MHCMLYKDEAELSVDPVLRLRLRCSSHTACIAGIVVIIYVIIYEQALVANSFYLRDGFLIRKVFVLVEQLPRNVIVMGLLTLTPHKPQF